jgi:putative polyketide hydroxylase
VRDYVPGGRPGGRAPHIWLRRGEDEISSLELFDGAPVLLTGTAGDAWPTAARAVARRTGVPLRVHRVGEGGDLEDLYGELPDRYGIAADGAVLIRPDGHVAWRCPGVAPDAEAELDDALSRVFARDGGTAVRDDGLVAHAERG